MASQRAKATSVPSRLTFSRLASSVMMEIMANALKKKRATAVDTKSGHRAGQSQRPPEPLGMFRTRDQIMQNAFARPRQDGENGGIVPEMPQTAKKIPPDAATFQELFFGIACRCTRMLFVCMSN